MAIRWYKNRQRCGTSVIPGRTLLPQMQDMMLDEGIMSVEVTDRDGNTYKVEGD